jgi:hypothetical protein
MMMAIWRGNRDLSMFSTSAGMGLKTGHKGKKKIPLITGSLYH